MEKTETYKKLSARSSKALFEIAKAKMRRDKRSEEAIKKDLKKWLNTSLEHITIHYITVQKLIISAREQMNLSESDAKIFETVHQEQTSFLTAYVHRILCGSEKDISRLLTFMGENRQYLALIDIMLKADTWSGTSQFDILGKINRTIVKPGISVEEKIGASAVGYTILGDAYSYISNRNDWLEKFFRKCEGKPELIDDFVRSIVTFCSSIPMSFETQGRFTEEMRKTNHKFAVGYFALNPRLLQKNDPPIFTVSLLPPHENPAVVKVLENVSDIFISIKKQREVFRLYKKGLRKRARALWQEICFSQVRAIQVNGRDSVKVEHALFNALGIERFSFICEEKSFPEVGIRFFCNPNDVRIRLDGYLDRNSGLLTPRQLGLDKTTHELLRIMIIHAYHKIVVERKGRNYPVSKKRSSEMIGGEIEERHFPPSIRRLPKDHSPRWEHDDRKELAKRLRKPEPNETIVRDFDYDQIIRSENCKPSERPFAIVYDQSCLSELLPHCAKGGVNP